MKMCVWKIGDMCDGRALHRCVICGFTINARPDMRLDKVCDGKGFRLGGLASSLLATVGMTPERYVRFRKWLDPDFSSCKCHERERFLDAWFLVSRQAKPVRAFLRNYSQNGFAFIKALRRL